MAEIANQLGVTAKTAYNWRTQGLIDHGLRVGTWTSHSADLAAARQRIREVETDLLEPTWIEARRQLPWFLGTAPFLPASEAQFSTVVDRKDRPRPTSNPLT